MNWLVLEELVLSPEDLQIYNVFSFDFIRGLSFCLEFPHGYQCGDFYEEDECQATKFCIVIDFGIVRFVYHRFIGTEIEEE